MKRHLSQLLSVSLSLCLFVSLLLLLLAYVVVVVDVDVDVVCLMRAGATTVHPVQAHLFLAGHGERPGYRRRHLDTGGILRGVYAVFSTTT